MTSTHSRFALALLLTACVGTFALAQEAPTSSIIAVSDKAALEANKEKDVVVEGVVSTAAWSSSGKVMNLHFEGTDETRFSAVVFEKNKDRIDKAFGGDATKAWTGAKVRIKGKLREYAGKTGDRKATPEITISDPGQVTVVEPPPADAPATKPAE